MGHESISLFTLAGTLQKENNPAASGRGKFTVVNKDISGAELMPYAGSWAKDKAKRKEPLGFSSTDFAWNVLLSALDQGFIPDELNPEQLKTLRSDTERKDFLQANGIEVAESW